MDSDYVNQVRLLISVLPDIASEEVFALKGGTAIKCTAQLFPDFQPGKCLHGECNRDYNLDVKKCSRGGNTQRYFEGDREREFRVFALRLHAV